MSSDPTPSQPTEGGVPTLPGAGRPGTLQPSSIDALAPGARVEAGFDPPTALVWFGVLGGALAWALQHVVGQGFGLAHCFPTGTSLGLPLSTWQIAAAAAAALVALAAIAVSLWIFLRTFRIGDVAGMERRGDGAPPPSGRLQFLSMTGLTVNVLALAIIVLSGVGGPILHLCQQS